MRKSNFLNLKLGSVLISIASLSGLLLGPATSHPPSVPMSDSQAMGCSDPMQSLLGRQGPSCTVGEPWNDQATAEKQPDRAPASESDWGAYGSDA
jgi:hypothetical protein